MKNGIVIYREKKGITQAELARLADMNRQQLGRLESGKRKLTKEWAERLAPLLGCSARDLMFPEIAQMNFEHFHPIWETVDEDNASKQQGPPISVSDRFLEKILPNAVNHSLEVVTVEDDIMRNHFERGDVVIIDRDDKSPAKPGVFAIELDGTLQWRYLSPLTEAGKVQVSADNASVPVEQVESGAINIIGRAKLRISVM